MPLVSPILAMKGALLCQVPPGYKLEYVEEEPIQIDADPVIGADGRTVIRVDDLQPVGIV